MSHHQKECLKASSLTFFSPLFVARYCPCQTDKCFGYLGLFQGIFTLSVINEAIQILLLKMGKYMHSIPVFNHNYLHSLWIMLINLSISSMTYSITMVHAFVRPSKLTKKESFQQKL